MQNKGETENGKKESNNIIGSYAKRFMNYSAYTLIIPTLNEESTIGLLIKYVLSHYHGMHVLVMDDGSTDNTAEIVRRIAKSNAEVKFIDRRAQGLQRGLTASIVHGISIANTKYAIIIDADLQHPPEVIGKIAQCLEKHNDLVIATRASVTDWPLFRRIVSKSLMLVGVFVLFLRSAQQSSDIFSGFFGVRSSFFMRVYKANKNRFIGNGYKALFDLLKCVHKGSVRVCEVPYVFNSRKEGKSKAGVKQALALLKSFVS